VTTEAERGCGYRRKGGLYLMGGGLSASCDRLPVPIVPCGCCGWEPQQLRSHAMVPGRWLGSHFTAHDICTPLRGFDPSDPESGYRLTVHLTEPCRDHFVFGGQDPICEASAEPRLLMWVGRQHYTPGEFSAEATRLGVSKRIAEIPKGMVLGKTWALLAHPDACYEPVSWAFHWLLGDGEIGTAPGVFSAFVPRRVELILAESEATAERIAEEKARGVDVVIIPDGAPDARVSWRPGEERPKLTLEDHAPPEPAPAGEDA
jgi:hypothetical protein